MRSNLCDSDRCNKKDSNRVVCIPPAWKPCVLQFQLPISDVTPGRGVGPQMNKFEHLQWSLPDVTSRGYLPGVWWGRALGIMSGWVGPQVWSLERVSPQLQCWLGRGSSGLMSKGEGIPYHDEKLMLPNPVHCGQNDWWTDACESITSAI